MLTRSTEFDEEFGAKPIYGVCIVTDPKNAPKNYTPILKTFDDSTDADLWKEGGITSFFSRPVRYLCINRIPENGQTEILHDLQIKKEDVIIPNGFTEISFTSDTKEKGLRKYRLLVSYLPKEKIIDAITDIIVVKTNKPYRGYTPAGEIDGLRIWYKASSIQTCLLGFPKSASNPVMEAGLYPHLPSHHSTSMSGNLNGMANDINSFTIKAVDEKSKMLNNLTLILNDVYVNEKVSGKGNFNIPEVPFCKSLSGESYKYDLERSILGEGY